MSALKDWSAGGLEAAIQEELELLRVRLGALESHTGLVTAPTVAPALVVESPGEGAAPAAESQVLGLA